MGRERQEPKYTLIKSLRLVVWHANSLNLTMHEWVIWQSALSGHADDDVIKYNHLIDFRDAIWAMTRAEITPALGFAERFYEDPPNDPSKKNQKSAIICNSPASIDGWEEFIELTNVPSNPFHLKVFQDFAEAISWLGHSDAEFRKHLPDIMNN